MKTTLTSDEFYTWVKDLAENGDTKRNYIDEDGYFIQNSERDDFSFMLFSIENDDKALEDQLWWYNASYEDAQARADYENWEQNTLAYNS